MVSSHAGKDKWKLLQKDTMHFLMNTKWNVKTFSLEKFCGIYHTLYVQLDEATINVSFQLPNECSRVLAFLIDKIVNSYSDLCLAIASIRVDRQGMCIPRIEPTIIHRYHQPVSPRTSNPVSQVLTFICTSLICITN